MDLIERMRAHADAAELPAGHELRVLADRLDLAADGYLAYPPTVSVGQFVGAWARARRVWCDHTGEPLV